MIIVDSSIWVDHINIGEPLLDDLLLRDQALMHPHVLGEVALGSIKKREQVLARFLRLPVPNVINDGHLLTLVDEHKLWSTGIGFTDAHLLASALYTPNTRLWTRDKRLDAQARRFEVAFSG